MRVLLNIFQQHGERYAVLGYTRKLLNDFVLGEPAPRVRCAVRAYEHAHDVISFTLLGLYEKVAREAAHEGEVVAESHHLAPRRVQHQAPERLGKEASNAAVYELSSGG
jgi:hypothetical protein